MPTGDEFASMVAALEASGLSRTEIAAEAHVSRMTVWRFAEGLAREPSVRTVSKIAAVVERHGLRAPELVRR